MAHSLQAAVALSGRGQGGGPPQGGAARMGDAFVLQAGGNLRLTRMGVDWGSASLPETGDFITGLKARVNELSRPMRSSGTGGTGNEQLSDDLLPGEEEPFEDEDSPLDFKKWEEDDTGDCMQHCLIISPKNAWKVRWDMFIGVFIIFTIVVLPFRIGFDQEATGFWKQLDLCIDVFFGVDLVLCFCTGYFDNAGNYIADRWKIAKRYFFTFFWPDLLSCIPMELLTDSVGGNVASLKLMKFVRLVRLMKLSRLLKLQRLADSLEWLNLKPGLARMLKLIGKISFIAHLLACLWYLIALPVCNDDEWHPDKVCPPLEDQGYNVTAGKVPVQNWVRANGVDRFSVASRYIASIHFVTATMMAVGYGDMSATNTVERIVAVCMQLIGAAAFGFILSATSALINSANPAAVEHKKVMSQIKEWMIGRQLSREQRWAILEHVKYVYSKKSIFKENEILGQLPARLRNDIINQTYPKWVRLLDRVFPGETLAFKTGLVLSLRPQKLTYDQVLLEAGEISLELYIVVNGGFVATMDCTAVHEDRSTWLPAALKVMAQPSSLSSMTFWSCQKWGPEEPTSAGSAFSDEQGGINQLIVGAFQKGEIVGQFSASPLCVRSYAMRSEVLCCSRDAFLHHIFKFTGAMHRYELREKVLLAQMQRCITADEVEPGSYSLPTKSLVLVGGRACEPNRLPGELLEVATRQEDSSFRRMVSDGDDRAVGPPTVSPRRERSEDSLSAADSPAHPSSLPSVPSITVDKASPTASAAGSPAQLQGTLSPMSSATAVVSPAASFVTRGESQSTLLQSLSPRTHRQRGSSGHSHASYFSMGSGLGPAGTESNSSIGTLGKKRLSGSSSLAQMALLSETIRTVQLIDGQREERDEKASQILDRWVIPPLHRHKFKWDLGVGLLIVYSVLVIPFRIGFQLEAEGFAAAVDIFVDIVFATDIVLNFRCAFVDIDGNTNTIPAEIRLKYLKGWFWVDFLSTFPSDRVSGSVMSGAGGEARAMRLIRIVRLVRLLKLIRLLRMGRLVSVLEDYVELSPLVVKTMSLSANLAVLAHLLGCFFFYSSANVSLAESGCSVGELKGCSYEKNTASKWWLPVGIEAGDTTEQYIAALYWAFTTMTTVGYGDIIPMNDYERMFAILACVLGATIFGYIVGSIAELASQARSIESLARGRICHIRDYCDEQKLSQKRQDQLRSNYKFIFHHHPAMDEVRILSLLPPPLRKAVIKLIHKEILENVGLFAGIRLRGLPRGPLPDWFVTMVVRMMDPQVSEAGEEICTVEEVGGTGGGQSCKEVFFIYDGRCNLYNLGLPSAAHPASATHADTGGSCAAADTGGSCDNSPETSSRLLAPSKDQGAASQRMPSHKSTATSIRGASKFEGQGAPILAVLKKGCLFGLHCMGLDESGYSVCASRTGKVYLFVIRQAEIMMATQRVEGLSTVIRSAVTNALLQQIQYMRAHPENYMP
eukprot:TRINITY_DN32231_c0_g2_i1.p1 TRINITY_DN32231_c0_g2~~TRINITY_DN32231_c0_g2_i1.p1  ORF type:complete len:1458 (+),score=354.11 TRINITY_DN32231_c0_g2_i1:199-4572(+)